MRKLRLSCRKKGIEKGKRKRFRRSQNLLTGLRNHCFKQQKGNQLVITEKNNQPNQKSTEIVFNENAKMVAKSLNTEGNSLKPF